MAPHPPPPATSCLLPTCHHLCDPGWRVVSESPPLGLGWSLRGFVPIVLPLSVAALLLLWAKQRAGTCVSCVPCVRGEAGEASVLPTSLCRAGSELEEQQGRVPVLRVPRGRCPGLALVNSREGLSGSWGFREWRSLWGMH